MQTYTTFQSTSLLILRIVTAAIFYVAAYFKFPYWSNSPEGTSAFLLFTTRLLSIAEPLGATAVLFGFLTKWTSVGLIIILLGAIYVSQTVYHIGFVTPTAGMEFPIGCARRVFNSCYVWSGQMAC